jgi:hypothetical protein
MLQCLSLLLWLVLQEQPDNSKPNESYFGAVSYSVCYFLRLSCWIVNSSNCFLAAPLPDGIAHFQGSYFLSCFLWLIVVSGQAINGLSLAILG